jgi:hypothetical protein
MYLHSIKLKERCGLTRRQDVKIIAYQSAKTDGGILRKAFPFPVHFQQAHLLRGRTPWRVADAAATAEGQIFCGPKSCKKIKVIQSVIVDQKFIYVGDSSPMQEVHIGDSSPMHEIHIGDSSTMQEDGHQKGLATSPRTWINS